MNDGGAERLQALRGAVIAGKTDPRLRQAARCGLYLALGLGLACARVLEHSAPFGMALVACAGAGVAGVSALTGAALGYLVSGGLDWGIRYIAASVLVYTLAFLCQELPLSRKSWFMPCAAGLVMAMTGFLGSVSLRVGPAPLAAELVLESFLACGGCYFFRIALLDAVPDTERGELLYAAGVTVLLACLLMALSRLELFGTVSVGRFLALELLMAAAMKGGALPGCAVGTVLGLAMDFARGGSPYYSPIYAASGLLSGLFGRHGRLLFALSFVLSQGLAAAAAWDEARVLGALLECFAASVIFMLLPSSLLSRAAALLQSGGRGSGEAGLRRHVALKLHSLSQVFSELYNTVMENLESPCNDENIARLFDRAADRVCAECKFKNRCWNAEYMDTLSAMNDASRAMAQNGSLSAGDLPAHFRDRCIELPAFVAAVNTELRGLAYRRQLRTRLSENRSVAWGQYRDMAQLLGRLSDELGGPGGADPLAERRLLRYLTGLDMDCETSVFRDGGGRLRIVIESGSLHPLLREADWLEKLSAVVGVRLCQPKELSEGSCRLTLLEAEPLAVSVGIASLKKRGEKVSGDKGTYFKTDAGVLCVILSDGMGCGDEAARDSEQVVSILERFLRSGADPAVAMKVLNSVMLLRGGDSWGFATVDLMCVDLFTGETSFYKYGAAPSYVKSGRAIRRIKGETLAAGLSLGDGIAPDVVRMRLKPGSTAIIASDGVIADAEDGWLKSLMQRGCEDMKELARCTLKEAEKLYGAGDDMTVLTVRVEERV